MIFLIDMYVLLNVNEWVEKYEIKVNSINSYIITYRNQVILKRKMVLRVIQI